MNYEEVVVELDHVIKSSEKVAVSVFDKLELALSYTKEKESSDLIMEVMNTIQEEDIFRQKLERVVNCICEAQGIDGSRFNIAPTAKHISGDKYDDEISQEDIDKMFANINK
ncbi:hypothetical protein [Arcobacter sp. F2176]|uniref:hypothetical protein n=1 Tax=Arcobacter sp. F2176 TaxID=2044511 RepID=UPI00100C2075|nr:hypothetical protein [Arcobacter sp. F2176]RXJ79025.1 hypothetical protein CRU95_15365 [Arcobacter sp. F2176]